MKESPYLKYKEEFLKLYKEGKSVREIARIYNIPYYGSVSRILKSEISLRAKTRLNDEEVLKRALKLYEQGYSIFAISELLGVSSGTLKNRLSKYVKIENDFKYKELLKDIKSDYRSGMSTREIGKKYSISPQTVCNYLHIEDEEMRSLGDSIRTHYLEIDYFNITLCLIIMLKIIYLKRTKNIFLVLLVRNSLK